MQLPGNVFPVPVEVSDPANCFTARPEKGGVLLSGSGSTFPDERHEREMVKKPKTFGEKRVSQDTPCAKAVERSTDTVTDVEDSPADTYPKPFAITPEILSNFSPRNTKTYRIGHSTLTNIAIRNIVKIQSQIFAAPKRSSPRGPAVAVEPPKKKATVRTPEKHKAPLQPPPPVKSSPMQPAKGQNKTGAPLKSLEKKRDASQPKETPAPNKRLDIVRKVEAHKKQVPTQATEKRHANNPPPLSHTETPDSIEDSLDDFITFSGKDYKHFFDFDEILSGKKSSSAPFVVPPPPTLASFFKDEKAEKQQPEKAEPPKRPEPAEPVAAPKVTSLQPSKAPIHKAEPQKNVISLTSSPSQENNADNDSTLLEGLDFNEILSDGSPEEEAIEDNTLFFDLDSNDDDGGEDSKKRKKKAHTKRLRRLKQGSKKNSSKEQRGSTMFLDYEAEESSCDDDDEEEAERNKKQQKQHQQPFRNGEDDDDFEDEVAYGDGDEDGDSEDGISNSLASFICDDIEYMSSSESQVLDPDEPSEPSNRNSKTENSFYQ